MAALRSAWRRWVLLVVPATLLLGCGNESAPGESDSASSDAPSRESIRVARQGGQTGMEGSCLPVPAPAPFSAADVRELIEGMRATTLAYRPDQRSIRAASGDAVGVPMIVAVELQGEPKVLDPDQGEGCNLRIQQDVVVTLSFDEPPLDVVIETTAYAFGGDFAIIQPTLGGDVAEALGMSGAGVTLSLSFNKNGMEGTIDAHDGCGEAVFPASAHCSDWTRIEVELDRERDGFSPRDALAEFGELGAVPLRWSDGDQTTLSVALTEPPAWACSGEWVETFRPERLEMPISVRMVTADGRLDAELPAELTVEVSTQLSAQAATSGSDGSLVPGEIESFGVSASYFGNSSDEGDLGLKVNLWKRPEGTSAEGFVHGLERRQIELRPPLDATVDSASCLMLTAGGGPDWTEQATVPADPAPD